MKNLLFIFTAFIVLSCEKDPVGSLENAEKANESFVDEFTEFTYTLNLTATGYTSPDTPQIYQRHEYRLAAGELVNGKYLYKIMRKSNFDYHIGSHSNDWSQMGWYRYNFNDKRGEFYEQATAVTCVTLMDFNLNPGESFLVDECNSISDLNFVVQSRDEMILRNYTLPVLKGRLVHTSPCGSDCSYESMDEVKLTPFHPSPFMRDLMFIELVDYDWGPSSFSEWQDSYCVTTIEFVLINNVSEETVYRSTLEK